MSVLFRSRSTMTRPKSTPQEKTLAQRASTFSTARTKSSSSPGGSSKKDMQFQARGRNSIGEAVRQVLQSIGNVAQKPREPEISAPVISHETLEACKSKYKLISLQAAAKNEHIAKREEDFERRDRVLAERRMKARARKTHPIIELPVGRPSSEEVRRFRGVWAS
ncbi:hypothetical protein SCHPADRAFT_925770 [Schizopora paradoxa]|uniref:Uncharacterized protein n=1 Tax=Schizopora paradoxa TaxID=27342 RepID=A0A0H2S7F9_9AGAM|nr:hypothetical protein SCHPADRAFT_925770 [Schizopora paradoxa]